MSEKMIAAFECEYCRQTYKVDLSKEKADCPGCSHGPGFEEIQLAIYPNDRKRAMEGNFNPASGGVNPAFYRASASVIVPSTARYDNESLSSVYGNRDVKVWMGKTITDENRAEIEADMIKHFKLDPDTKCNRPDCNNRAMLDVDHFLPLCDKHMGFLEPTRSQVGSFAEYNARLEESIRFSNALRNWRTK